MYFIDLVYQSFCTDRFPVLNQEAVSQLEERIGVSFPEDYRAFLLEYNGGWFNEPQIVPPSNNCPIDRLTVLKGIHADHASAELGTRQDILLFDDNEPPQVIPIGYTLMGNLILLITHDEENGSIVLKIAASEEFHFLAANIQEFFRLLREPLS